MNKVFFSLIVAICIVPAASGMQRLIEELNRRDPAYATFTGQFNGQQNRNETLEIEINSDDETVDNQTFVPQQNRNEIMEQEINSDDETEQNEELGDAQFSLLTAQSSVKLEERLAQRTSPHSLRKKMPASVIVFAGSIFVVFATTVGYLCYRIGKYVHTKINQQKDVATLRVSANVIPAIIRV